MRPKLISLLVVSAVALMGCSAGEPSSEPTATVTVTAEDPAAELIEDADYVDPTKTVEFIEDQFASFAELRAEMNAAKKPSREKVIDSLHRFCEEGEPFDVSATEDLNKNLEAVAPDAYCERLEAAN